MSILRIVAILALLCAGTSVDDARAQEIDFGQINKFESLGTGTLQVGAPPKTIIDELSPETHPAMRRVLASFEPCWLGGATGRGAEPST